MNKSQLDYARALVEGAVVILVDPVEVTPSAYPLPMPSGPISCGRVRVKLRTYVTHFSAPMTMVPFLVSSQALCAPVVSQGRIS